MPLTETQQDLQFKKDQKELEQKQLSERMAHVKHKIVVLSGKGGVGKSTVAVNLAYALKEGGKQVGLLDVDIHGPSIPKLLGCEFYRVYSRGNAIMPFEIEHNLKIMSIGFLMESSDDAIIWRGPLKYQVIKQFLKDVEWGDLDFLVIDSPPGTGDEPLSVAQLLGKADGAIIVTTPQQLAIVDVRKCVTFCRSLNLPVLGVIENMSGFRCPTCGSEFAIFKTSGGEEMAANMKIPFLGKIPLNAGIVEASDAGIPFIKALHHSEVSSLFRGIVEQVLALEKAEP